MLLVTNQRRKRSTIPKLNNKRKTYSSSVLIITLASGDVSPLIYFIFGLEIRLLRGKEYTVGRKNVDILLADDASISRKHATLLVEFAEDQLVRIRYRYALVSLVFNEVRLGSIFEHVFLASLLRKYSHITLSQ